MLKVDFFTHSDEIKLFIMSVLDIANQDVEAHILYCSKMTIKWFNRLCHEN